MISLSVKPKKIIAALAVVLGVAGIGIWLFSLIFASPVTGVVAADNEARVKYLQSLGWEVDPQAHSADEVTVPEVFDEIYTYYNSLQTECGFDLKPYAGKQMKRYTYVVKNHPEQKPDDTILAELLISDSDEIVGGSVYSLRIDGFMQGLKKK